MLPGLRAAQTEPSTHAEPMVQALRVQASMACFRVLLRTVLEPLVAAALLQNVPAFAVVVVLALSPNDHWTAAAVAPVQLSNAHDFVDQDSSQNVLAQVAVGLASLQNVRVAVVH